QIMTNLISNAIKFNNKNGLVSVSVSQEDNQVLILVKDSGIGIPKEMQQEVFESFTNYGRAGSFGEKSTGLGLSITKRLVALHNGELSIVSEQTTGTTMKVRLPNLKINSLPV
ncbi:MAG: signal transduction histidine kinase, partial [Flavobacteriales bacterium]